MTALIEINPGTWIRPERVTAVRTYAGGPNPYKKDAEPFPPTTQVVMRASETISWEFTGADTAKAYENAKAFAAKIAAAVNDAATKETP